MAVGLNITKYGGNPPVFDGIVGFLDEPNAPIVSESVGTAQSLQPPAPLEFPTPIVQDGDVNLFQTMDDGDIIVEGGIVEMNDGLATSAYVSMFGGNEDDTGRDEDFASWWGNADETDPDFQYRSETQNLLQAIPATSANLRRIEDAAVRDLEWMITKGVASEVNVSATIPDVNQVALSVDINAIGEERRFVFLENWKAAA